MFSTSALPQQPITAISERIAPHLRVVRDSLSMDRPVQPIWKESVEAQLEKLGNYEEDWDGFRAGPIRSDVLSYAKLILREVLETFTPPPHISPMSNEGILIEWHKSELDLEIEIEKFGEAWVYWGEFSHEDGKRTLRSEDSFIVKADLKKLIDEIHKLSE